MRVGCACACRLRAVNRDGGCAGRVGEHALPGEKLSKAAPNSPPLTRLPEHVAVIGCGTVYGKYTDERSPCQ